MKASAIRSVSLGISLVALAFAGTAVHAANQCKGQSESACGTDTSCRWVSGYERKDGRQVSAHCRTRTKARSGNSAMLDGRKVSVAD